MTSSCKGAQKDHSIGGLACSKRRRPVLVSHHAIRIQFLATTSIRHSNQESSTAAAEEASRGALRGGGTILQAPPPRTIHFVHHCCSTHRRLIVVVVVGCQYHERATEPRHCCLRSVLLVGSEENGKRTKTASGAFWIFADPTNG